MNLSRLRTVLGAVLALLVLVVPTACGGSSAPGERIITLTLIRNAESLANEEGVIETAPPGPPLSPAGQQQAESLANRLKGNAYDGIYTSQLLRSEQSAAPLARALGGQATVLPGLNEIPAGWFEGSDEEVSAATYRMPMREWLRSNREFTIPGSVNGGQFNGQFSGAIQKIYEGGDNKPVAFSSGYAIMMWILMNVRNPKDSLLDDHPLPNTGYVVVTGNPVNGWTLQDWNGITNVSPDTV
ncbi:MAG: histidine phosphatase family protein [Mycobacterium sp.]